MPLEIDDLVSAAVTVRLMANTAIRFAEKQFAFCRRKLMVVGKRVYGNLLFDVRSFFTGKLSDAKRQAGGRGIREMRSMFYSSMIGPPQSQPSFFYPLSLALPG